MEGRKVEVVPYNPIWNEKFLQEAEKLQEVFGRLATRIHHIGSTSVPGLAAKPIIDILIETEDLTKVDKLNRKMVMLGYYPKGENGIKNRRYFQKGGVMRTHHVHVFPKGHEEVIRHLAFRDFLRAHPETAKQYSMLKQTLAAQFPYDIEKYREGKSPFILKTERLALQWYQRYQKRPLA
jgi:GrpB-like predicted nucleotidyltransferase (UPF0157 family)